MLTQHHLVLRPIRHVECKPPKRHFQFPQTSLPLLKRHLSLSSKLQRTNRQVKLPSTRVDVSCRRSVSPLFASPLLTLLSVVQLSFATAKAVLFGSDPFILRAFVFSAGLYPLLCSLSFSFSLSLSPFLSFFSPFSLSPFSPNPPLFSLQSLEQPELNHCTNFFHLPPSPTITLILPLTFMFELLPQADF
jgi:hypothetical protein